MEKLDKIFRDTQEEEITADERMVIFSDLHMGNGGRMDDFLHNSRLFKDILEQYYEKHDYKLVLNGDIEELHRFSPRVITSRWQEIFGVFLKFHGRQRLQRLLGNHDYELYWKKKLPFNIPILEAVKLRYHDHLLFIFHGHQANPHFNTAIYWLISIILRLFANLLRIKNFSVAHNNRKKFKVEKRIYDFARKNKIMAIIGHTHRPLFESLSKKDTLKFKIETLCREYTTAELEKKPKLAERIKKYKKDLMEIIGNREEEDLISTLYNSSSEPLVPCMFNSGCAIGKSGITSIEISGGNIRLVYWFDTTVSRKYLDFNGYKLEQLGDSTYYRVVLKEDNLDYMFTRIMLLSD